MISKQQMNVFNSTKWISSTFVLSSIKSISTTLYQLLGAITRFRFQHKFSYRSLLQSFKDLIHLQIYKKTSNKDCYHQILLGNIFKRMTTPLKFLFSFSSDNLKTNGVFKRNSRIFDRHPEEVACLIELKKAQEVLCYLHQIK